MPTSIAPHATAFGRRPGRFGLLPPYPSTPGVAPIDGGTGDAIGLMVELYLNNTWTDISQWVYYRDGATKIPISRGRGDETSQVGPQSATIVLDNRDGRFSPRNPIGPYYGQLTRNTRVRVSRLNNGIRRYRFYGEIPAWPVTSDVSHSDITTTVTAAGMLRRLRQGNRSIGSAMKRAYTVPATQAILTGSSAPLPLAAYWPCEDGTNSTTIASGIPGAAAMAVAGTAEFARDSTSFVCSSALPQPNGSVWTGTVPTYTGGVDNVINYLLAVPSGGAVNNAVVCRVMTLGAVARLDTIYTTAASGSLQMVGYSAAGVTLFSSSTITGINASPVRVQMMLQQSGPDIFWQLTTESTNVNNPGGFAGGTLSASTVGNATVVYINPGAQLMDTTIGHISVQYNAVTALQDENPLIAWELDNPDVTTGSNPPRFTRLCLEQNVNAIVMAGAAGNDTVDGGAAFMGFQLPDTFGNLIQQPVDMSLGLLFESRDQLALVLRTRGSLYNQAPKLTLDWSRNQLSGPLVPLDDDSLTRNDVQVSRIGGSSAVAQQAAGTLSIQDPPAGVGDYGNTYSISLYDDSGLADHAGWRLHMGTVDEPRYPQIMLNLRHPTFTTSVDMMNAALTLEIGDRVVIKNPPAPDFPPDDISLIVQGYSEVLGTFEHDMVLTCSPESPYRVGLLDDAVLGHLDTDGSTLAQPVSATATSLQVTTTGFATGSPLWTTSAGDFPFDINIGGERITVQNITGAGATQTFSPVVRSVNGVVKSQTASTDVRLWQPLILSL